MIQDDIGVGRMAGADALLQLLNTVADDRTMFCHYKADCVRGGYTFADMNIRATAETYLRLSASN